MQTRRETKMTNGSYSTHFAKMENYLSANRNLRVFGAQEDVDVCTQKPGVDI